MWHTHSFRYNISVSVQFFSRVIKQSYKLHVDRAKYNGVTISFSCKRCNFWLKGDLNWQLGESNSGEHSFACGSRISSRIPGTGGPTSMVFTTNVKEKTYLRPAKKIHFWNIVQLGNSRGNYNKTSLIKYSLAGKLPRKLNVDLKYERKLKWTDNKLFVYYMKVSETVMHAYRNTKSRQSIEYNNNLGFPDVNWKASTVRFSMSFFWNAMHAFWI